MPDDQTIVDAIYRDYKGLSEYLDQRSEPSYAQLVADSLRRNLVVSAASLFEQQIKDALIEFSRHRTDGDQAVMSLVRLTLVDRGFHTMFDWKGSSPNSFFSYFGDPFGSSLKKQCSDDYGLKEAAKAFLELGQLRNAMVHSNFAVFTFEKTAEEAYDQYRRAKVFVDFVITSLSSPLVNELN